MHKSLSENSSLLLNFYSNLHKSLFSLQSDHFLSVCANSIAFLILQVTNPAQVRGVLSTNAFESLSTTDFDPVEKVPYHSTQSSLRCRKWIYFLICELGTPGSPNTKCERKRSLCSIQYIPQNIILYNASFSLYFRNSCLARKEAMWFRSTTLFCYTLTALIFL